MNRRQFGQALAGVAAGGAPGWVRGQATREMSYGEQFPDMLLSHLARRLNTLAEKWDARRAAIRSPEDLRARNHFVRQKFLEMIHGFPQKTPLNPRTVRQLERDGYRVENIIFQSRPGFWVTGNLYVPTTGSGPFPGIISPCGHSPLARMQPAYQFAYLNLVRAGFVVLAYDPVGQGERRQYWNPPADETESNLGATYEHSIPGQLLLLLGEDLTHYRIWDGIRAIDYLESRPEVDPQRIGCAGHSGGGTLTMFITPLEDRIRCAVICEGGTARRWPIRIRPESRIGPADVEQNLFPAAVHGIDLADLHIAIAPRPLLALIEEFTPRFNEAADQIRARYSLLGVPERFAVEEATDPHAWTVKLRLATTRWFARWFLNRPGPDEEPEFEPEPPENLYCTPNGSIRYSRQGETIFSLIQKKQAGTPPKRNPPASTRELEIFRREITDGIRQLLNFRRPDGPLGVRRLVTTPRKRYSVEKLEFLSEPDVYIPVWVFVPDGRSGRRPAILYINDAGKEAEGTEFGALETLARKGHLVIAVDVRGTGGTRTPHPPPSDRPGEFGHFFGVETAMSYMAWFMDESLFGMRVRDVLRSVDYVMSRPDVDGTSLRVIGKGRGALWALYAAVLDPRIKTLICEGGLVSYRSLTQSDRYLHGADVFIRDVLKWYDLPQVAAALCDRRLVLLSLTDPMKRPVEPETARRIYRWTVETYSNAGAASSFQVLPFAPVGNAVERYLQVLESERVAISSLPNRLTHTSAEV